MDLMKLQSGSCIKGVAFDSTDRGLVELDETTAGAIGGAFAYWLGFKVTKNPYDLRICVGHDPRITSESLKEGVLKGVTMFGAEGYDAGISTAPAMFMSTVLPQFEFDGAVMITADDISGDVNGFKFFTAEGNLTDEDVAEILRRAGRYAFIGEYFEDRPVNVLEMYAAYLRQMISMGIKDVPGALSDMNIVVCAGNGSGGFLAKDVLESMGADISGSMFLKPHGTFADPDDEELREIVSKAVLENNADLGIILDADADRAVIIGPYGRVIEGNELIAMASALAAEDYPGGTVVTDSNTSLELHDFLENELGLRHCIYKSEFAEAVDKAKELKEAGENAFLAAGTSGHVAYSDNYFLDDGMFLAVQIIINAAIMKSQGKDIYSLTDSLTTPAETWELVFDMDTEDPDMLASQILEDMEVWAEETEGLELEQHGFDGVRVGFELDDKKGWFLLRKALHEAAMPLVIESSEKGGIRKAIPMIGQFLRKYEGIKMPEKK